MQKKLLILLISVFLSACQVDSSSESTSESIKTQSESTMAIATPAKTPLPTIQVNHLASDLTEIDIPERKTPEEWREWPVVAEVTKRSLEIYYQGLLEGIDSSAFSKIGDCQNVKDAFLGKYDRLERYPLDDDEQYLLETIENFSGNFNTDGQAVRGGFNAATVLSPLRSDPTVCLSGESPLVCELRLTHPSIVFVSFELWWEGRTVDTYEKYMRQIIETIIEYNAVPVLATKADNIEGDHSINLATARLAYEYDIPLWNFWRAVQPLPAQGMDVERNDAFHISPEAWEVRSVTALQSLDHIWKNLRVLQNNIDATTLPDRELFEFNEAIVMPEVFLWNYGGNILFDIVCLEQGAECKQGVYRFDTFSGELTPLLLGDYLLESISPKANYILLSQGTRLYLGRRNNGSMVEITNSLYQRGELATTWVSDDVFASLVATERGVKLLSFSVEGLVLNEFTVLVDTPTTLYSSGEDHYLYWDSANCLFENKCEFSGTWGTDIKQDQPWILSREKKLAFDSNGSYLAYPVIASDGFHDLMITSADGTLVREYPLPQGIVEDLVWNPNGDAIAITLYKQSNYSGRILEIRNLLIDVETWAILEYTETNGFAPQLVWSSGGENLFWMGTQELSENEYRIIATCLRGCDTQIKNLSAEMSILSPIPITIHQAIWLP